MDIKRVDDKHINIHKKEETKLHKKDHHITSDKALKTCEKITAKEKANVSTKALAKGIAIASGRKMLSHIEGGEEIEESIYLGNVAMEPLKKVAYKRKQLMKNKLANANRRIKKVEKGKKLARRKTLKLSKRAVKQVAKKTVKTTTKETAKFAVKEITKAAVEVGATVAGTVAGTAGTGPYGPLIGVAVGELAGFQMDVKDVRATRRMRMLKYFQDKLSGESTSKDSLGKLIKDVVITEIMLPIKYIAKCAIVALLMMVVLISVVVIPVVAVVEVLYSSPFAIFLPPLEPGDTVTTVLTQYMSDFNREVITLSREHEGCDTGKIVYVDYEGTSSAPSNYYDILCIYMVKFGFENTATIMDDSSKEDLKAVFDDMCTYTTSESTETIDEVSQTVLNVNISLKYYRDMQTEYDFREEQIEVLVHVETVCLLSKLH